MLAMNKLVEDVAIFMEQRAGGEKAAAATEESRRNEIVIFAHNLSVKHEEHVSVELVDTLITSYNDSLDKEKDEKESTLL